MQNQDQTILSELAKRAAFKSANYNALYYKAKAQGDGLRASLYASLAYNAAQDASEYQAMIAPYTEDTRASYASA